MSGFVLSQILAGAAFCSDLLSFQLKERRSILICLCVSSILLSLHFFILGRATAGAVVALSALRFAASYFTTAQSVMYAFMAAAGAALLLTFSGTLSLLACTASLVQTYASFRPGDRRLRQVMMGGTSLWIVHNALAWTPAAALIEVFFLLSNLIGYYRFYLRRPG